MDNYIVSARKYRPSTFQSVVGQKSLTTTLKNAIQNNKLAHAYLFCGPRGVGKTTCARIFAKTINCLSPTDNGEACNTCESCQSFNEQRSYNIHELDAASNNSVDDIRSLIEQVRIPPQIGKYKVYIIDEVHMLSSAAFNAFLKTLEEPPRHAVFVLATTEKHKILPTILSRCQIYDFSRISITDTIEHLQYVAQQENVTAESDALSIIAQKADGGMRDALSIFDQVVSFTGGNITYQAVIDNLNVLDYEYYFKLTDAILQGKVSECMLILNEILSKGFEGQHIVTGLASHLRDLMVCKDPQTIVLFEVGDAIKQKYVDFASRCHHPFLYKALEWTNDCDLDYKQSRNKRLLLEILLIRLCQLCATPEQTPEDKKKMTLEPIFVPKAQEVQVSQPTAAAPAATPTATQSQPVTAHPIITVSEKPATTPSTSNKRLITEKLAISLKAPYAGASQEKQQEQQIVNENLSSDFTQEALNTAWSAYAKEHLKEQVYLQQTMLNSTINRLNQFSFEVLVYNAEQEQRLKDKATDMMTYLRGQLRNSKLEMQVKVCDENVKQLVYSDIDKYQLMVEHNQNLAVLTQEFKLNLD